MVLVHGQRAYAFEGFALAGAQVEAVAHHVALHAQVVGQTHVARAAHLLQHHMQHQRRALAQRGGRGPGPFAGALLQRGDDGRHGRQGEVLVDFGLTCAHLGWVRGAELAVYPLLHGSAVGKGLGSQAVPQRRQLVRGNKAVRQVQRNRVARVNHVARQAQPFPGAARAAAEEITTAHIREQANGRFRHGHLRALGHDARARPLADAHAAAHHDAVHESDIGLGIVVNQMIERVLFGEEVFELRIAGAAGLVQKADVTTRAQRAKHAFLVAAAQGHRQHLGVVLPLQQCGHQVAHHLQRQRIERTGAVQGDAAYAAPHFSQHQRICLRHFVFL